MTNRLPLLNQPKLYALDANVFIAAWRDHYPPDLYPGFWKCLEHYSREGRLLSIDRVRSEIDSPKELIDWVNQHWHNSFAFSGEPEVMGVFSDMQNWVQTNDQFLRAAKDDFARTADGWLAAYAKVHNAIAITNEVFNADIKRKVPIPNLCRQFDLAYSNTVGMLRGLGARFDLR